ncbi:hypothetical protein [Actinophytocola sp.]|uniref:hypothetical protein n=1 Tax=Actinophytocola sp. TaxID=1872138 RepID=UPI00389A20EC
MSGSGPAVERARLMAEGNRLRSQAYRHDEAGRTKKTRPLWRRVDEISRLYEAMLPEVTVARCPHSGELVRWRIDTFGLDGWFWEYNTAIRRLPERLPGAWLAMTGAMRLAEPIEHTPYVVNPGPGVPFVVPRILDNPDIRAVIAEVPVGIHTGWAISYFGPKPPVRLVNTWGKASYPVFRNAIRGGWDADSPIMSDYDFALTKWLRSGALLWIIPGDESATLREGSSGCPFVALPGSERNRSF